MGRWAEVYFKTPPENREQAVLELLQELEREYAERRGGESSSHAARWTAEQGLTQDDSTSAGASGAAGLYAETEARDHQTPIGQKSIEMRPSETPRVIHCRSCGQANGVGQRFCGMCGGPMADPVEAATAPFLERGPDREPRANELPGNEHRSGNSGDVGRYEATESPSLAHGFLGLQDGGLQDLGLQDIDRLRAKRATSEELLRSWDYPPSRSYRGYIGAILVVVIVALGYVAWKNAKSSGASPLATQAPVPAATESAQPAPAAAEKAATPSSENRASEKSASQTPTEAAQGAGEAKGNGSSPAGASGEKAAPVATATAGSAPGGSVPAPAAAPGGNGSEELAIAKNYLNASGGHQADSREAVDWLWKSVAKRNAEATMLLSDLYLRGNGIGKNCDQARVLLDAAASRGIKEAGVRLRNMQAFGCQ